MTTEEVLTELAAFGNETTKRIFSGYGAREPFFGVKIGDLKKIQKRVKKNHELSLALYETGNSDAMYLAGLIADEKRISQNDLQQWIERAYWFMLSEYVVAKVAADSPHGWEMGLRWIESENELVAAGGWSTLSSVVALKADQELDLAKIENLLETVKTEIHDAPNRVRYAMNDFVIAVGSYVAPLSEKARKIAAAIGTIKVNVKSASCTTPDAAAYIAKVIDAGKLGKKRKMARC